MAVSISGDGAVTGVASINTDVSSTELGYLDGVTSAIQPQIAGAGGLVLVGQSSFSASSGVSLNGAFTADYDNYQILVNATSSTNTQLRFRLRAAGTDLTSASYNWSVFGAGTTSSYNQYLSDTTVDLIYIPTGQGSVCVNLFAPYLSLDTRLVSNGVSNHTTVYRGDVGARVANTNSYDGCTIYPNAGTITGTVRVYGYAQ